MEETNTSERGNQYIPHVSGLNELISYRDYTLASYILEALKATEPHVISNKEEYTYPAIKPIFEGKQRELLKNKLIEILK